MVLLTEKEIDVGRLMKEAFSIESGAVVHFVGTVREEKKETGLRGLRYEAYREMAEKRLHEILGEASARWGLKRTLLVHRLGEVPVGEASIVIAVSSPHRKEAFEACSWIIDSVKQDVPIWKYEIWD